MSTITGFVTGIVATVAVVSYYPQLLQRLDSAAQTQSGAAELAAAVIDKATATLEPTTAAGDDRVPVSEAEVANTEVGAAVTPAAAVSPVAAETGIGEAALESSTAVAPAAQLPTEAPAEVDELELRWANFAAAAAELEPAGTFPWQQCFERAAAAHQIPQTLLLAVASGESGFDPAAISNRQAIGLMQIRWPQTSRHLGVQRQADLFDPCRNVDAGARYLVELRERYQGNLHLALAAYNYGPGRISPGQVPDGANWYSQYIYQHLEKVLGRPQTPSSVLKPEGNQGGQQVLMTFTQAHRARQFSAWLDATVPGLRLQQRSERLGLHDVILLYSNTTELEQALRRITATGVAVVAPEPDNNFYL